ncbi:23S rRNA (cytidine(2498)-2'-O)-methyltransferase RlmM [Silvimonas sp.]|uniref:23S rRNA (cytidine(2498)-2'-O)-methyltransferase RlmM n=1 Tax=Silvimonas sp. TaxID=2650811 RepID=UPI002845EB32|nr:23S rRNA (cytidine(2498)-2'-O)-methyltransferase RlmM [Silvimonas sp.]MDR3426658.1 23S rRNA (cytidine(2498)-2'-O)-methyltransferase RlmM [Silvimonas sp.]
MRHALLFYCRAGFENDCRQEWEARSGQTGGWESEPGFALFKPGKGGEADPNPPEPKELIFARQTLHVLADVQLGEKDRLTPILDALKSSKISAFNGVWLEHPDSDAGKPLSGFTRRFTDIVEKALNERNLIDPKARFRLHLFFPSMTRALVCSVDPEVAASPWLMGIPRVRMPSEAPSRSTLKLSEAFMTLVPDADQLLKSGMTGVDLGAAPGGWTFQLVARGLKVFAVDNGPMKGDMAIHPHVKHMREDGFKYKPQHPVDWLVCDMVEQPARIAQLIAKWLASGTARHAVFNLKLPMKKRWAEIERCFELIDQAMGAAHVRYSLTAKHLYHDREEITCYLTRLKAPRR